MNPRFSILYPRAWRSRYGDEYEALLETQSATPAALFDVLFGALDAHLTGEKGVTSMAAKWRTPSAVTIMLGGLLWFLGRLAGEVVGLASPGYLVEALGMLVVAIGVIGLARLPERGGRLAVGLAVLAVAGIALAGAIQVAAVVSRDAFLSLGSWPRYVAATGLLAQSGFAAVAVTHRTLPWPPLAALGVTALLLAGVALSDSPGAGQYSLGLVLALSLCWVLVGGATLMARGPHGDLDGTRRADRPGGW